MARQIIDIGAVGNDGTGDSIRDSFNKVNQNFLELYSSLGLGTRLTFLGLSDAPASTYAGYENSLVTVNQTETGLKFKELKGGVGVTVDTTTNSNQIILNAVFSQISADKSPHLGGNLSAFYGGVQYRVKDLVDPITNDEAARKGYVDTKISRAGVNAIDPATGLTNSAFGYMSGPLILSRSPVPDDDNTYGGLIAATKSYVDGAAFGSAANLYVATSGLDARPGVSDALQGRALAYAYRTIEAALKRAEELILQSRVEIGPYKKVLTYNGGLGTCTLSSITTSSQSGSGFIGSAIMSVDTVTLSAVGTNYNVGDIITLSGGTVVVGGQAATIRVLTTASTPGAVLTYTIQSAGSYVALPGNTAVATTVSNANQTTVGAGATFNVTYKVSGVQIASGGSNYGLVSVRITGGGGSGAFGTAYISNGVIQSISVTDKGSGFTSVPTVVADLPTFAIYTAGRGTDFSGNYLVSTPAAVSTRHIRPGMYLRGETSGALAQILTHTGVIDNNGNEVFDVDIKYGSFQIGEAMAFGDTTKNTQVTVMIESGIYYENYPLKIPQNVAVVGDEFRRVIIKPASGTSTSPWAFQYFRRDLSVDGLTTATQVFGYQYLTDPSQPVYPLVSNAGGYTSAAQLIYENKTWIQAETIAWINSQITNSISPFTSGFTFNTKTCQRDVGLILDSMIFDLRYGSYNRTVSAALKYLAGTTISGYTVPTIAITTQLQQTLASLQKVNALVLSVIANNTVTPTYQSALVQTIDQAFTAENGTNTILNNLFLALENIISGSGSVNYPKNNNQLDVFLCNDATMVRRVTAQGHGGFMMVLDPAGQILAKSPYCQESASFIGSTGRKQFAGGMFVDGFAGNLEFRMTAIDATQTKISITGLQRFPLLPASVIVTSTVYRVNYVRDYVYATLGSNATFVLDPSTPYVLDVGPQNATVAIGNPAVITKINHGLQSNATVTFNSANANVLGINLVTGTASATTATTNLITLNSTVGLTVGQSIVFTGTGLSGGGLTPGVYWVTGIPTSTTTATATTNSSASFANSTITGTSLTVAGTITGTIVAGMYLTGLNVLANTYIVSGSGTSWVVSQNHSVTVTNQTLTGKLNAITLASTSGIIVGDSMTFSGTSFGGISTVTTYYVTYINGNNISIAIAVGGVPTTVIAGTGSMTVTTNLNQVTVSATLNGGNVSLTTSTGSITWSATSLTVTNTYGMYIGLPVTLSGSSAGGISTGSYYIINIPNATTLILSSTLNGTPLVATSAVSPAMTISGGSLPTGLLANTRYYVQLANLGSNSFTVSTIKGSTTSVVVSSTGSGVYYDRVYELLMPGNRSMLSNDYTQVADLGYGVIVTNGGLTEAVSMFTYYCQISYYSINGGQIRSIAGSSAHGVYALVAEGSDPLEVPTPTDLYYPMQQAVTCYFPSSTYGNSASGLIIYVTNYLYVPLSNSELEIDHGTGILYRYPVNTAYTGSDLPSGVVRLTLGATTGASGLSGLYASVANGTIMTVRQNQTIMLTGNLSSVSVRPSTGLVLSESSNVYRVLQFVSYSDPNNPSVCTISNAAPAVISTFATTTSITGTISQNTITVGSNTGIAVNQYVTGPGIGTGAYVTSIVGTTISLSVVNSGSVSGTGTFAPPHGLLTNYTVTFSTTGTLPTGLNTTTTYYIVNPTATTFQVATLRGGTAITTTSAGSGTFYYTTQGLTTTLLRENYVYINLTVYQPNDYVTYSTTATATSSTGNLITVGSTSGMQIGMPISFGAVTVVTATDAVTNYLTVSSSYNMVVNMPIQFTGTAIGGVALNTTYYVANIISGTQIQISASLGGPVFSLNSYPSVAIVPFNAGSTSNIVQVLKSSNPQYTQVLNGFSVTTYTAQSIPLTSTVTNVAQDANSLYWDITLSNSVIIPSTGSMIFVASTAYSMTATSTGAFGSVVTGNQYYVASIPDGTHITITPYQQEATTATATSATGNLITVGSTTGMLPNQPITFNGVNFTASVTAASTNLITINSTTGLSVNQQVTFAATTQTPTLTGTATGTNLLTLSSVSGLSVGEPIVFTQVTQTPTVTATSYTGTITLSSASSLSVGEPIVFTQVTQTGTVTATSNTNTGTITLSGSTAAMVVGESIVFSQITQTTTATAVSSSGVLTVSAGGTTGMVVGGTVNFSGTPFGGLSTGTTYYILSINAGANQINLSASYGGGALAISGGTGSLTVTAGSSYGGLTSATTYYIKSILTSNTITVTSSYSTDVLGSTLSLTQGNGAWTYTAGGIFGNLVSGNTYYITSVNNSTQTITVSASYGGSNYSLLSGNGAWTSIAGGTMGGIASGSSYYITQVNTGTNTIQISGSYGGSALSLSSSNGSWTTVAGGTFGGLLSATTYYIKTLDSVNNQITVSLSNGGAVVGLSNATGSWVGTGQNSFGGITQGTQYYILTVPDGTHISITASSGSSTPVTLTNATGVLNVAASITTSTLTTASGNVAVLAGGGVPTTITIGTSTLFTTNSAHGLNTGDVIKLQTTGALPTGLTVVTHYFIISTPTTTTFTISLTPSGTSVSTSGSQSGTQTFGKVKGRVGDTNFAVVPVSATDKTRIIGSILNWKGVDYIVTRYDPETVTNTAFARVFVNQINLATGVTSALGLNDSVLSYNSAVTLKAGVRRGTANASGTLTIRIALTRVTGHDLLEIGTGSYADTNYPHEIYGPAVNALTPSTETQERTVGRVFYVTTDQYGNFRVGPYFSVDQGTGKVSFSAAIALSNLDGLGFKRGVPVSEFSTDSAMTNNAIDTVPVQNAVRTFVDRRLGVNYSGAKVDATQIIPAGSGGFMALSGILAMKANMDIGSNRIVNVANPVSATDAVNLQSLTLGNISGFTFTTPTTGQIAAFNSSGNVVNASITGDIGVNLSNNTLTTTIAAGAVTNAKIASGAAIDQAKLNLTAAPPITGSPGSYSQSQSGLASFDSSQFTVNYGWATIKDNGLLLSKLAQIAGLSVIGNSTISTANAGTISFATIVDSGNAIKKGQYTTTGFLRRTGGTGLSDGDYTIVEMTAGYTGAADNSKLVVRDSSGNISINVMTANQFNLNTSGANAGVKTIAQGTSSTGGYTQYFGYLGAGGILVSDGTQASDKKNLYWNNAHYFKTIDGGSDAPIQASQIQVGTITAGSTTANGTITGYWSLSAGSRLQATYSADLAEYYEGDKEYDVGTVLVFGGEFDVTLTNIQGDTRVAGIVSNNAGYVMYDACPGLKNLIALAGRVPCKVVGKIKKGDILITSKIPGVAVAATGDVKVGTVVGKALRDYDSDHIGLIEIAVGRA